jgi:hypothetical protein
MTIFKINCDECRFHVDSWQCCAALPEEVPYKGVCVGLGIASSPKCFITIKTSLIADGIFDRVLLALHIFSPSKLAAFISLKVTKRMTSAGIVQKIQSFLIHCMFRVPQPKLFISFIPYVTSLD